MEKIKIKAIVEVAGKPESHVKETVEKMIGILKENKKITLVKKEIAEPKKHELTNPDNPEHKVEVFSSFMDVEIDFPDFDEVMQFVFNFMPSSVEVIEPENLKIPQKDVENVLNDLTAKLHEHSKIIMEYQALRQEIIKRQQTNQK